MCLDLELNFLDALNDAFTSFTRSEAVVWVDFFDLTSVLLIIIATAKSVLALFHLFSKLLFPLTYGTKYETQYDNYHLLHQQKGTLDHLFFVFVSLICA